MRARVPASHGSRSGAARVAEPIKAGCSAVRRTGDATSAFDETSVASLTAARVRFRVLSQVVRGEGRVLGDRQSF